MQSDGQVLLDSAARSRNVARARAGGARRCRCRPTPRGARPGPKQAAPAARSVVRTAQVPFRWHKAKRAKGYDLRIARDRRFTSQMQTVHVRVARSARLLLAPGRWFWKVRSTGKVNSRWSNITQVVVRPKGDAYPPTRPTALRVTAVAADSVTVMFGASRDDGARRALRAPRRAAR